MTPKVRALWAVALAMTLVGGLLTGLVYLDRPATSGASGTTVGPPTGCTPSMNPVQCENTQPGTPIANSPVSIPYQSTGDPAIQGFATQMSVAAGTSVSFKVDAPTISSWYINIFRMGYYHGLGSREWASHVLPSVSLPQSQPPCDVNPGGGQNTGLIDCGNWAVSASWQVPTYAVSGMYIALLVRADTGAVSEVPFVVTDPTSTAPVVYQTSDATWEAYNAYNPPGVSNPAGTGIDEGNSLYQCSIACPPGTPGGYTTTPATEVSYNRPLQDGGTYEGRMSPFYSEFPMIYFLEENGYDMTYISEMDTDSNPSALNGHQIFISSGHDEYWSGNMRNNVQAAVNHGVNLAFFSGDEVFWKTQFAKDPLDATPDRTMISYKETHNEPPYGTSANQFDPSDPSTWTGTWRDPQGGAPDDAGTPENALTGQLTAVDASANNDDIQVPYQYANLPVWANTSVAQLTPSSPPVVLGTNLGSLSSLQTMQNGFGTLGYEWDADVDNGFRPAGEIDMSSTTDTATSAFVEDYGTNVTNNTTTETHHLSLYRAASGALVFGAGTVQFSWGLDPWNPIEQGSGPADRNMQQFVVNLFAMMGVQPATLISGLVPGAESSSTTPPSSVITSPTNDASLPDGAPSTITGTATTNAPGDVVAGVEVSTDGGTTWHPATLNGADAASMTWSYSWQDAHGVPSTEIESRATDSWGNIEAPTDGVTVNISCGAGCSIFGSGYTPAVPDSGNTNAVTVGLKFDSTTYGVVDGISFYKASANIGTHVGMLWSSTGTLLAQATFTNETASGWQHVQFSKPVPILPNTTYVVSYYAPNGHNSEDNGALDPNPLPTLQPSNADAPPLHAVRNTPTNPDGVWVAGQGFPTTGDINPGGDNFGVDVLFTPQPAPGPATALTANAGFEAGLLSWNAPTTGGPVTSYTITPYIGSTPQPTTTVTGTPAPTNATVIGLTNGTTYTFTVTASNPSGTATPSAASNPITPSVTSPPVFIQQASAEAPSVTNVSVSPTSNLTAGNRLVVEVVESAGATTNVTDSVGDTFTKLTSVTASNGTQMSIWTAPITNSGGTKPVITATPSTTANMTIVALEYQGLSGAPGSVVLDQVASAAGTTTSAATVQSGPTSPSSGTNEEAIGFYADQGSNDTLAAGSGYTPRVTVAPTSEPEALVEDQVLSTSGTPNAPVSTGSNTTWMMATVVLKSEAMTPPTLPEAPAGVTATGGDGSAQVSWTPPSNGGALISSYAITPYIGGVAQTPTIVSNAPPVSSTNIGNLTPGASYTFTVAATNTVGTGAQSAPSNAVTVLSLAVPAAPTNVTSTAGNTTAAVSWTAPSQDGGAPITSYLVTPGINTSEGITYLSPVEVTGNPPATGVTVTGLDNGTTYVFTVQAVNVEGTGASSQSNAVTPGTVPDAPTGVNATLGPVNGDATVVWTPPADNGGSTITSYTVTPYVGSTAEPSLDTTVTGTANSGVVDGLVVGTTYTFNVTATNALGVGPASQQSNQVTPVTAPGVPFAVTATAGTGSVTVAWTAPSNTGGSSISSYTVTPYLGSTAQTPVTVSGSPPATSATLSTLTNGSTYTFTVSATNSAGAGPASATSNLATPEASAPPCPCTVFGSSTPAAGAVDSGDSTAVNVGMAFSVDQPGYITGVRFYKAAANTGTHVGDLWSASGTELAQATFTGETASGWQLVSFSTPVAVSVGTTYVVSYTDPNGHYSATSGTFSSANVNTPPLYGLATTTTPDGLYSIGSSAAFPTLTYQGDNYWVDPVFNLTPNGGGGGGATAGAPTAVKATAGTGSVTVAWTAPSNTGGSSISSYTVTPYLGSTAQTPVTVSGSPPATSATLSTLTNGSTYTFTVSATNSAGAGPASATSNLATPEASAPPCPCTVFGSSTPAAGAVDSGDSTAVNVGMAFSVDQPGYITGVRFYKAAANTGTHVGDLWSASGTELAQATFTGETASGWQLVSFSTPVAVSVGTTYVVSYTDPNGHYSATSGTFSSANVNTPPLYGLATTTTPDGLYSIGSSAAFPTLTYQGDNYWVDPVFNLTPNGGGGGGATAGAPTAVKATAGTGSVTVAWTAPSNTGGSSISSYTVTPYLGSTAQTPVTVSGSPPATSATLSTLTNGSTYTFTVSATNSAGAGPASATSNLATPEASAPPCPCTVFGSSTPAAGAVDSGDSTAVNVGMAFSVDQPGYITGVRFYKAAANTGTHVGDLWSASGTELAQATFTGETASGWQLVSFSTPVAVSVGTTYVVSYTDPNGHYSATSGTFSSANVNTPPLYGLATTTTPDGLYSIGSSAAFPTLTYQGDNYWVDPVFNLTPNGGGGGGATAGAPTAVKATAGTGSVTVAWTAPSNTGGSSISSYTVTPYLGSTAQTPVTVSGSPPATSATLSTLTNGSTYTFTVSATNSAGAGPASATSNLATPEASAPPCPCTVFGSSTPAAGAVDSGDSTAVNVGMAFSVDQPGYITGVRFYKAAANTGTHVGDLWSASGTELAQATFTGETASGWQLVSFSTPVAVSVGTTYVVSYTDPNGHYSATSGTFSSANVNTPPLYGLATTTTPDGLYSIGSSAAFPTLTYQGDNYWVDPVFNLTPAVAPGAPTAVKATAGTGSVTVAWTAPSNTGGSSISSYTVTPYLGSTAQTPVTVSGSPPATSATLSTLTNGSTYTFTVSATNSAGAGPASATSNLATPEASAPPCPCTVFGSSTPAAGAVDSGDSTAVNVGMAFSVDQPGYITGVRFYKAAANTGTHVGDLWSASGTELAQATFTGETASGWQLVSFSTPVAVSVGTTYVVSYTDPNGHYSATSGTFSSANVNTPPLYGLATTTTPDGLYSIGSSPAFPTLTYQGDNYWVDPVFNLVDQPGGP